MVFCRRMTGAVKHFLIPVSYLLSPNHSMTVSAISNFGIYQNTYTITHCSFSISTC